MPIANPSPYPTETPLATLRAHVSLPPSFPSLVLYRLLPPPPPTSLLYSIRPLLAARTRVSGEPPPLNHHARDRHIHRDIAISCVNYRPSPPSPSFSLLSDPRGHHARVVSSPVIVVCDAANLYYAAHRFTRASRLHAREKMHGAIFICGIIPRSPRQNSRDRSRWSTADSPFLIAMDFVRES